MSKMVLGRGLSALLGGGAAGQPPLAPPAPASEAAPVPGGIQRVPLNQVVPSPLQPRKEFSAESLRELADSIRAQGILQPLITRARGGRFELIAGERRWRAAQLAGLAEVPVLVREADDRAVLELALIENLQRENLNPLEEALGYQQLAEQFQLRQEDIAAKVGRSRAAVANALRLLRLPAAAQDAVRAGKLSVGHAKVLLGLERGSDQAALATRVLERGLSVRQLEELVAARQQPAAAANAVASAAASLAPGRDPHVAALENRLRERLATRVTLRYAKGKGAIDIRYFSDAELERILEILGVPRE